MDFQEEEDPVTPLIDVYKEEIQSDGSRDNLMLIIVVKVDLQNKVMIADTWDPTSWTRTLKYFLANYVNHKTIVHQLDFIGVFL